MLEESYNSMKMERRMEDSDPLRHLMGRNSGPGGIKGNIKNFLGERDFDEYFQFLHNGAPQEDSASQLKIEELINKFGENTLFFIFYYQQNTYKQLLAAEELVKRNW